MDLHNKLKIGEEDISNSRKYYNALVREYNDVIMSVPTNIVASLFHFEKKTMFEVANASEREYVQVNFLVCLRLLVCLHSMLFCCGYSCR